jgi:DNA mismatch endonuclease (patch repair protein)
MKGIDPFTPEERSAVMRRIPSKGSSAEVKVRKALTALGLRYRLHRKELPGSPDIVMPGRRLALFVHACFWHGHDCKRGARQPTANADYWSAKIARNSARDLRVQGELRALGWRPEVVWECELKDTDDLKARLKELVG